jgi:hypothetical protein
MTIRLDTRWTYNGLRALVLENAALRVVVLPETGGRIYSLVHKPTDTEFLWHHPRNLPRAIPYGSSFDDTWPGGWDEILPSTEPSMYRGDALPGMGELWALPWEWRDDGPAGLYTGVSAAVLPLRFERWLSLHSSEPTLHVRYRITNLGLNALDLNWGIHPVLVITPAHRIDLPQCTGSVGQSSSTSLGEAGMTYEWPRLPTGHDISRIQPFESNVFGGHYATGLADGWFALTDTARRVGFGMRFPENIFSALWMWQVYGGWRGLYQLAIEPWVGWPVRWEDALAAGRVRCILPGASLDYSVSAAAFTGLSRVTNLAVRDDGALHAEGAT